jgi:hypothetical protein
MRRLVLSAAFVLVATGCGADTPRPGAEAKPPTVLETSDPSAAPAPEPRPVELPDTSPSPPPIYLRADGREIALTPWTYCWSAEGAGLCADGLPPDAPPDIGSAREVEVAFAATGFQFTATAERAGVRCGRAQTMPLEATGASIHRLRPIGPAGDYVVTLFGRGGDGSVRGDLSVSFRWHTPIDGPNEAPTATASIFSGAPDRPTSYGVELSLQDLRTTPARGEARASVLVTNADGASVSIDLERRSLDCSPEGSVFFVASQEPGMRAATLGSGPFRYDATVVIDSVTYRGMGSWPDDVDEACSPCTTLRFSPALPGL